MGVRARSQSESVSLGVKNARSHSHGGKKGCSEGEAGEFGNWGTAGVALRPSLVFGFVCGVRSVDCGFTRGGARRGKKKEASGRGRQAKPQARLVVALPCPPPGRAPGWIA
jgi:hypothetical protein